MCVSHRQNGWKDWKRGTDARTEVKRMKMRMTPNTITRKKHPHDGCFIESLLLFSSRLLTLVFCILVYFSLLLPSLTTTITILIQMNEPFEDVGVWIEVDNINASSSTQYGSFVYQAQYKLSQLEWATTYELQVEAKNEFGWNRPNEPFRFKVLSGMMTHLLLCFLSQSILLISCLFNWIHLLHRTSFFRMSFIILSMPFTWCQVTEGQRYIAINRQRKGAFPSRKRVSVERSQKEDSTTRMNPNERAKEKCLSTTRALRGLKRTSPRVFFIVCTERRVEVVWNVAGHFFCRSCRGLLLSFFYGRLYLPLWSRHCNPQTVVVGTVVGTAVGKASSSESESSRDVLFFQPHFLSSIFLLFFLFGEPTSEQSLSVAAKFVWSVYLQHRGFLYTKVSLLTNCSQTCLDCKLALKPCCFTAIVSLAHVRLSSHHPYSCPTLIHLLLISAYHSLNYV